MFLKNTTLVKSIEPIIIIILLYIMIYKVYYTGKLTHG